MRIGCEREKITNNISSDNKTKSKKRERIRRNHNKNIIKVKHRLYDSLWWNCCTSSFEAGSYHTHYTQCTNVHHMKNALRHMYASWSYVDGRYVTLRTYVCVLTRSAPFFFCIRFLLLHIFSLLDSSFCSSYLLCFLLCHIISLCCRVRFRCAY